MSVSFSASSYTSAVLWHYYTALSFIYLPIKGVDFLSFYIDHFLCYAPFGIYLLLKRGRVFPPAEEKD